MPEHDEAAAADAGEAINDIRRFVWAAADVTAAQDKVSERLDKVRAAFDGTRERLEAATEQARRLAQNGMSINRADMDAVRAEQLALIEALQSTFGQIDKVRDRFWIGALCLGIGGGIMGGAVAFAAPFIIRGITQ